MSTLARDEARRLFGDEFLDPDALVALLGSTVAAPEIPFAKDVVETAQREGCLLVYRPSTIGDSRLTLGALLDKTRQLGDGTVRFQGDFPWFEKASFAKEETPEEGWALVTREPWPETANLGYLAGADAMRRRAGNTPWRRRRAVEIAFDCLAFAAARQVRLLQASYDWSSTASADGGFINIGGFGEGGLQVVSYSKPIKHGTLGICPTRVGH